MRDGLNTILLSKLGNQSLAEVDLTNLATIVLEPEKFSSSNSSYVPVQPGDEVAMLIESKQAALASVSGQYNQIYNGTSPQTLFGGLPSSHPDYEPIPRFQKLPFEAYGYVNMSNVNNQRYVTTSPFSSIAQPVRVMEVIRRLDTLHREYFSNNGNAHTLRDANGDSDQQSMRMGVGEDSELSSYYRFPLNEWAVIETVHDGANSFMKVNGIQVGTFTSSGSITRIIWGANNNSTYHHKGAQLIGVPDNHVDMIYNELVRRYGINKVIQGPHATNISIVFNSGVWTLDYDYQNPTGLAEDTTATEVYYASMGNGSGPNLAGQTIFAQITDGNKNLIRSDYPSVFPSPGGSGVGTIFRPFVRVHDENGNKTIFNTMNDVLRDNIA
ncbi:MAG: hypothetical protein AAF363_15740 [Bacteroidota bacterium]